MISESANIAVGAIGAFFMLAAYALLSFRRHLGPLADYISEESVAYCALNLVGGALASASAVLTHQPGSYPLAVLEGAWAVVGAVGLAQLALRRCAPATKATAPLQPSEDAEASTPP